MLFEYDLTIPANTPASAKVRLDMVLARGIIHDVGVDFRAGARHEVNVVINRATHQVFPANPDAAFVRIRLFVRRDHVVAFRLAQNTRFHHFKFHLL